MIKRYMRRMHIADDCDEPMPERFNFVKVIVGSEGVPLNMLYAPLHQNDMFRVIKKVLVDARTEIAGYERSGWPQG